MSTQLTFSEKLTGVRVDGLYPGYRGAVLAPNGYVYFVPYYAHFILKVDPVTLEIQNPTADTIPGLKTNAIYNDPSQKWVSGTLATNGKIYCAPYTGQSDIGNGILVIDTNNDTYSIIPTGTQLRSTALGKDGNVYMPPWAGDYIRTVFPSTDTTTATLINWNTTGPSWINDISRGAAYKRYWGAVPGPDNKIYGVPYGADRILIIDTDTGEVTQGEDIVNGGGLDENNNIIDTTLYQNKWSGGVISPINNCIYCIPRVANTILKIDTTTDRVTEINVDWPAGLESQSKYFGGVLGPDNKIYSVIWASNTMMIIDPRRDTVSFEELDLSGYATVNGYAGGVLTNNGEIILAPWGPERILKLTLDNVSMEYSLPDNLLLSRWCNNTI